MKFRSGLYQEDIKNVGSLDLKWECLKGKKVLITGASGMIGTFLIDVLMYRNKVFCDDITIWAMSRNMSKLKTKFAEYSKEDNLKLIEHDVAKKIVLEEKMDYIIHAASNTHPKEYSNEPINTITSNVWGLFNLLEYARKIDSCKVILLSSVEIYGENRGDVEYFTEKDCGYIDCNTLRAGYPESKRLAEAMMQAYRVQTNIETLSVRLSRVYGPTVEKDDSKVLSQFINKSIKKENIVLKSNGTQMFSYVYVADAVSAIIKIMTCGISGEAYNVASVNSNTSLLSIAEWLAKKSGTKVVFEIPEEDERRGYSTATKAMLDATKLETLGWSAKYDIKEGLNRTIQILQEEENDRIR